MRSRLLHSDRFARVETDLAAFLNLQDNFLTDRTAGSPRAIGDALQDLISDHFGDIVGQDIVKNYSKGFARRAMADLAFEDIDNLYYIVDVKTHMIDTKLNMPNLTSVERLTRFYEDDRNYFVVLMIAYNVRDLRLHIQKVHFVPVEFLSWSCLTIGALGWGQVQIANSNRIDVVASNSRRARMLDLCATLLDFYPRAISKINERIAHFQAVQARWRARSD